MERYRFYSDQPLYFVTFSIVDWLPVFISEAPCQILADSLNFCHERKHLRIHAYVIMPTHFHAIVSDADHNSNRLSDTLIDFRKFTGRQLVDYAERSLPKCFVAQFSQAAGEDRDHRVWQPTKHPVALSSEEFWLQKLNYLHENPCRKGLVRRAADWRFSSAAYYHSDGQIPCDVRLTRVEWD